MTKKESSRIMRFMAISLLSLFLFPLISALELQLSAPDSVDMNEEFKASISADSEEIHDVKIFVEDADSKTISQIYNSNDWQSSYYYVKEAFPAQLEFNLKITKAGNWDICARLRKGSQASAPVCKPIVANQVEEEPEEEQEEKQETKNSKDEEEDEKEDVKVKPLKEEKIAPQQVQLNSTPELVQEKIVLKAKPSQKISQVYETKQQSFRNWILYGFIALCIAIIVLLSFKRL